MTAFAGSGRFTSKVALVTGAASGIGRAVALRLGRDGATVIVADRDVAGAVATIGTIRAPGGNGKSHELDVTSDDAWRALVREVAADAQRLDIVVHAAGVARSGSVMEGALEEWYETMRVNADGTMLAVRHSLLAMRPAGRGSIVTLGSLYGAKPKPGAVAYSASKAAVAMISRVAALEARQMGLAIRVNCVLPGMGEDADLEEPCPLGRARPPLWRRGGGLQGARRRDLHEAVSRSGGDCRGRSLPRLG